MTDAEGKTEPAEPVVPAIMEVRYAPGVKDGGHLQVSAFDAEGYPLAADIVWSRRDDQTSRAAYMVPISVTEAEVIRDVLVARHGLPWQMRDTPEKDWKQVAIALARALERGGGGY